ncbi:MAG: hypothetical protein HOC77_13680 [Chloroflexi bacterium]|jgi:hypothetical protein|nr:hypothetical protein [Chloroflexota bacterium]MBT4073831.1 hypothetical protein [Chloroflexota bacterium]MBT4516126.1 hypothetical protein [Chloroflexota bacterium]MBT6682261.1 hypothetical protein [Chloroflexota bacterium]
MGVQANDLIFYEDPEEEKGSLRLRIFRNLLLGWAMFISVAGVGVVSLLILFPPGEAIFRSIFNDACERGPVHTANIDIGDATVLQIIGDRGDLAVEGRRGRSSISVVGRSCGTIESRRHFESIVFTTSKTDDEIIVAVKLPRKANLGELQDNIRMDVQILVPENFPRVEIDNGDGSVFVANVRELQAVVGFGNLDATNIGGAVDVDELIGSISLIDIRGDVEVDDLKGYGEVFLTAITGNVNIGSNQSGPARISDIGGDVTIGNAGTGRLTVARVGGDLSVDLNLLGRISIDEIEGLVSLPGDPGT